MNAKEITLTIEKVHLLEAILNKWFKSCFFGRMQIEAKRDFKKTNR